MTTLFPHDFSEARYCKALKGLFKAGTGVAPPTLAGRDTETAIASDMLLDPLADGNPPPGDMVLFGPRGNGKTVLLKDLERRAIEAGIGVRALTARNFKAPGDLAAVLLRPASATEGAPDKPDWAMRGTAKALDTAGHLASQPLSVDGVTVGAPGLGTVSLGASGEAALMVELTERLTRQCRTQPLLVTVDEAHTLDIEIGADLLNLSQQLRSAGVPFVLILAGTPNLQAHLRRMDSTFWSRSEIQPIGRLSAVATKQALTEPLGNYSVTIEPDALEAVVDDSQCYPYFIQLWGRALCGALVGQAQGHTVTLGLFEQVAPEIEARRARYYGERYLELEDRHLLEAAALIGKAFKDTASAHKATLEATLVEELGLDAEATTAALSEMAALGYLWRKTTANDFFEPGIPSLMTHVQERLEVAMDEEMTAAPRPVLSGFRSK